MIHVRSEADVLRVEFTAPEDRDGPTDEQLAAMEQQQRDAGELAYLRSLDERDGISTV